MPATKPLLAAPWPKVAKLARQIVAERRPFSFTDMAEEIGESKQNVRRWVQEDKEPKREAANKIIAWCEKWRHVTV